MGTCFEDLHSSASLQICGDTRGLSLISSGAVPLYQLPQWLELGTNKSSLQQLRAVWGHAGSRAPLHSLVQQQNYSHKGTAGTGRKL